MCSIFDISIVFAAIQLESDKISYHFSTLVLWKLLKITKNDYILLVVTPMLIRLASTDSLELSLLYNSTKDIAL